jgi:hypothetical protein
MRSFLRWSCAAALVTLALGAFGCTKGNAGGESSDTSQEQGLDDACGKPPEGAPEPPTQVCMSNQNPRDVCPLPKSVSVAEFDGTTVYYYSHPTCVDFVCHYCVTSTYTEDPGATAAP